MLIFLMSPAAGETSTVEGIFPPVFSAFVVGRVNSTVSPICSSVVVIGIMFLTELGFWPAFVSSVSGGGGTVGGMLPGLTGASVNSLFGRVYNCVLPILS